MDFKGGMMVRDVTTFRNVIWGIGVCFNVCAPV